MPVSLACPHPGCGRTSTVADAAVGKRVKCPACGRTFAADPPAARPPAASATAVRPTTADGASTDAARPRAAAAPAAVERVGRFVVKGKLGEGAFGAVYRAFDPQLDREVALKVPHAAVLDSPKRVERFLREARAAANLRHPHIVPVFDAGTENGRPYIASAFVAGQKLSDAVEASGGGLDLARAARLVRELAEALAYAHEQGIVHRDVKPDNVLLDAHDRVHLTDFGLAMRQDEEAKLTTDGAVMGTPAYMAPEQAAGDTAAVGPAADQYACGVVLYELLTGKVPFAGPTPAVLHHHLRTPPAPPGRHRRGLPRDLETVCLMALNKRPGERYDGCRALADDLRRWLEGEPVSVRPLNAAERAARWVRREPRLAAAVGALLLVLLAGTVAVAALARQATAAQARAEEALREKEQSEANAQTAADEVSGALGTAAEERERALLFKKRAEQAEQEAERAKTEAQKAKQEPGKPAQEAQKPTGVAEKSKSVASAKPQMELKGHTVGLYTAAFSPDGTRILTLSPQGKAAKVWDAGTGKELHTMALGNVSVYTAAFSPDGTRVFISEPTPKLWNAQSGKEVHSLKGHKSNVFDGAFSPDGRRVVTACSDQTAKVWDVQTGKEVRTLTGHTGTVLRAAFSPDGTRVVTGSGNDRTAKVWDAETGKALHTLEGHSGSVQVVMFSPDGTRVLTLSDGVIRVWDALTGKLLCSMDLNTKYTPRVSFSPDGTRIVTANRQGSALAKVWDVRTGEEVHTLKGHTSGVYAASFSPDGTRIVTGGADNTARVWDARTGEEVLTLEGHAGGVISASFSPDGTRIVTASADKMAMVWLAPPPPGSAGPPPEKK